MRAPVNFSPPPPNRPDPMIRIPVLGSWHIGNGPEEKEIPDERIGGDGWYGIRSRSRFLPPQRAPQVGHGGQQVSEHAPSPYPEPNTETQFPPPWFRLILRFMQGIGQRSFDIAAQGGDDLTEGYRPTRVIYHEPITSVRADGWPRWEAAGPPAPSRQRINAQADRREFFSQAQTFSGVHTEFVAGAKMPTSPVRMIAARAQRLTRFNPAPSFGSQTEVIE